MVMALDFLKDNLKRLMENIYKTPANIEFATLIHTQFKGSVSDDRNWFQNECVKKKPIVPLQLVKAHCWNLMSSIKSDDDIINL